MYSFSHAIQDYVIRISDIIIATLLLILLAPFFLIIAIFIKLDSSGEVFFKQERVGKDGEIFMMYKFRSMCNNADKMSHKFRRNDSGVTEPVIKRKNDSRVTRIGRFLRKYSIDELPQLFNVVMGHMSLVGPRPPVLIEEKLYTDSQRERLKVKPGLTGLAQIANRSDLSFDQIIELDKHFIDNRSIILYYKIIFLTIPFLFSAKGAY